MVLRLNTLILLQKEKLNWHFVGLYKTIPLFVAESLFYNKQGECLLVSYYLLNAYLCCLVSYTYNVSATSERDAGVIVSNLTLVNEFTID